MAWNSGSWGESKRDIGGSLCRGAPAAAYDPAVRTLVTGATGKVGGATARALLDRGDEVRALVRDPKRAAQLLPSGVELVRGDVTEPGSVTSAVAGCELVFNA